MDVCFSVLFVIGVIVVFLDARKLGKEVYEEATEQREKAHREQARAAAREARRTRLGPKVVKEGALAGTLIPSPTALEAAVQAEKMLEKNIATVVPVIPGMEASLCDDRMVYYVDGKAFSDLALAEKEVVNATRRAKRKASKPKAKVKS